MTGLYLYEAVDIAREAGALLAARFGTGCRTERKGTFDVVTDADRATEALILHRLRSRFPSHAVEAEESGGHTGTSSLHRWFVDPLDGSKNFARGYPAFAVSIALEYAGDLIVGVVFDPIREELFCAERGAGAFLNGQPMCVSDVAGVQQALLTTGFPSASRHRLMDVGLLTQVSLQTQGIRRTGSSALDLSYVACGRVDAFWDLGLRPWDVAAGVALIAEAGGRCSNLRGEPHVTGSSDLLATNRHLHAPLTRLFSGVLDRDASVTGGR